MENTRLIKNSEEVHEEERSETTVEGLLRAAKAHLKNVESVAKDTLVVINNNPKKTCLIVICGVVFIAPMVLAGPVLGALGFSAAGPVAGSLAAAWQASIGSVAAGSLFAILQGAAMGDVGAALVGAVVQLGVVSILGVAFRKRIINALVSARAYIIQFAQDQLRRLQMNAMQRVLQAQNMQTRRRLPG